jgi:hypothetical protein
MTNPRPYFKKEIMFNFQFKINTVVLYICNILYKGGPVSVKADEKGGVCGSYGSEGECIQALGGITFRKESLGRPGCRWKNNI